MLKEKGFYRGINLGGWLSQCDYTRERLDGFIQEADFEKIASWGLDHVRIPLDYNVLEEESGGYIEEGFLRVSKAIQNARKQGMNVVLDLHKTAGYSFDPGEKEGGFFDREDLQERFLRLWEELAKRFGGDPDHVAFELLNEVTSKSYIQTWNKIAGECITRIRSYAPDTLLLVGSYDHNSARAVEALDPPADKNVLYNFHCYEPLFFTHQGAYWNDTIDQERRVSFGESGTTEAYFEELFASAIEKARREGTELYCGEYGVIDVASPEDTLKWFTVIHKVFEKYGISRAAWSYREMDFGISDPRMDEVREQLLQVM